MIILVIVMVLLLLLTAAFFMGFTNIHILHEAKRGQVRVACVGDSITYGMGVKNWPKNNYPEVLQRMLGEGYCVNNYGYSNRTVMKTANHPYVEEALFQKSLAFQPELVVIKLGTNDAKVGNWRGREAFKSEYLEFVGHYSELPSNPGIILCTPATIYYKDGTCTGSEIGVDKIPYENLREETAVIKEIGQELGLEVIDVNYCTQNHREWFQEGLHPNRDGAAQIAELVYQTILRRNF